MNEDNSFNFPNYTKRIRKEDQIMFKIESKHFSISMPVTNIEQLEEVFKKIAIPGIRSTLLKLNKACSQEEEKRFAKLFLKPLRNNPIER